MCIRDRSNMSLEAFENFYYDVCTLDYAKMSEAMDPLVDLMNRTDKVLIVSPGKMCIRDRRQRRFHAGSSV